MNLEKWIATDEICTYYKVERTFVNALEESGIVEVKIVEEKHYFHHESLPQVEKMIRLHYDLQINLEGLEAIQTLLEQVKHLQEHNRKLKNRLHLYE